MTVPAGFTSPVTDQTSPGAISFYGPFALSPGFLARCGSKLRKQVGTGNTVAANAHAVIWEPEYTCTRVGCRPPSTLNGLFVPTLRRFRLTVPATASLVAMSANHIYAATNGVSGSLYVAPAPNR